MSINFDYKEIVCTTSVRNHIYVWGIDKNGKKHRLPNSYAINDLTSEIENKCEIKECKSACLGKKPPKLPCIWKRHLFNSKYDLDDYCKTFKNRPKGDYEKELLEEMAELYSQEFNEEKKEKLPKSKSKSKNKNKKVRFRIPKKK